jgi:Flp pilus assembly pilin Flp
MSPGRRGRGMRLRLRDARADNASVTSVWTQIRRLARRDERGQAIVEFALIAPVFLMLVVGVIQFAIALNFWFDLQRLANQGARAAAVNCGMNSATSTTNLCTSSGGSNLELSLREQFLAKGEPTTDPNSVEVCYVPPDPTKPANQQPTGFPTAGDAVRVALKDRYRLQAVVNLAKIDLRARAIMRLEQAPNDNSSTYPNGALPNPTDSANWVLTAHTGSARCQP